MDNKKKNLNNKGNHERKEQKNHRQKKTEPLFPGNNAYGNSGRGDEARPFALVDRSKSMENRADGDKKVSFGK